MSDGPACDCYPGGFSPETYEGPQVDCPVHGDPFWARQHDIPADPDDTSDPWTEPEAK